MFGFLRVESVQEEEVEEEQEEGEITNREMELKIRECNDLITQVNHCGWEVYKIPDDASVYHVREVLKDVSRLYSKVRENRPHAREELGKIINCKQALLELEHQFSVYDLSEVTQNE